MVSKAKAISCDLKATVWVDAKHGKQAERHSLNSTQYMVQGMKTIDRDIAIYGLKSKGFKLWLKGHSLSWRKTWQTSRETQFEFNAMYGAGNENHRLRYCNLWSPKQRLWLKGHSLSWRKPGQTSRETQFEFNAIYGAGNENHRLRYCKQWFLN